MQRNRPGKNTLAPQEQNQVSLKESGMNIVRFQTRDGGATRYGLWQEDQARGLAVTPFEGPIVLTSEYYSAKEITLLAPCTPTKIVAVGLNYRDHATELGMPLPEEPLLFLKPASSVIGPDGTIELPVMSKRVDYEAELSIVMGSRAKGISLEVAEQYILGYTCLNDVTARDLQKKDVQFTRAKSFDTFCPIGPWIATGLDASDLGVQSLVNGELRQSSRTSQLIHGIPELVSFVSQIMTLEPGDVIATGTPAGIGTLHAGDEVVVRIEGIGDLRNSVSLLQAREVDVL